MMCNKCGRTDDCQKYERIDTHNRGHVRIAVLCKRCVEKFETQGFECKPI